LLLLLATSDVCWRLCRTTELVLGLEVELVLVVRRGWDSALVMVLVMEVLVRIVLVCLVLRHLQLLLVEKMQRRINVAVRLGAGVTETCGRRTDDRDGGGSGGGRDGWASAGLGR
jgi:hypothetical protein